MHAWEIERKLIEEAIPVIVEEEEQTWSAIANIELSSDQKVRLMWNSHVPGSGAPECLMAGAVQSMENMGYKVEHLELPLFEGLEALRKNDMAKLHLITSKIFYELHHLTKDKTSPFWQYRIYDTWEQLEAQMNFPEYQPYDTKGIDFLVKIYEGWLCQICAGAFGTAIEGYCTERLKEKFGEIYTYVRKPNTYNDDITYELAFLEAFKIKGYKLTSQDIAEQWIALIPFGWSAEDIALTNLRLGIYPPESGYLHNPFREWIGAQMRGAICGMVAPGNPKEAARLAFLDGVISHHNNGVLGEIFNAVMVSLAFAEKDVRVLVQKALEALPKDSEYYEILKYAFDLCQKEKSYEIAWRACEEKLKKYNWVHAYPNAAAELIALWYGNGDFDLTMHIIAMEGQDVDCNGAQIATVLGVMQGEGCISEKWVEPIGDGLDTYVRGMKRLKISELAQYTVDCVKKFAE
jgi:ADP-ribosylglycohydrolase